MKKIFILTILLSALFSFGQSKKEQIITLENRVDSFRLALSNEIKLSNENINKLNSRVDSFRSALSNEKESKLISEKRNPLKINNLKDSTSFTTIKAEETITEKETIDNNTILTRTLDYDLNLLKESYTDNNGNIKEYYNYNPKTGLKFGPFDNGVYSGIIHKEGSLTSDNYFHIINPNNKKSQTKLLFIKGKITKGKLNGNYKIYERKFKEQWNYDPVATYVNSYITGFTQKVTTYSLIVDKDNYVDVVTGNINFKEGKYFDFEFEYEGESYTAKYTDGIISYYERKSSETQERIDFFEIGSKLYFKNGKYYKNQYPEIVSKIDSLRQGNNINCDKIIELPVAYNKAQQEVLIIDPLNNLYDFTSRDYKYGVNSNDYTWRWISYLKSDYSGIYFVPLSGGYVKQIGIDNYGGYSTPTTIPSIFKLSTVSNCNSSNKTLGGTSLFKIPFFFYNLDLDNLIKLYGSQKGYSIFYSQTQNMNKKKLAEIKQLYPDADEISIGNYLDIDNYPNK